MVFRAIIEYNSGKLISHIYKEWLCATWLTLNCYVNDSLATVSILKNFSLLSASTLAGFPKVTCARNWESPSGSPPRKDLLPSLTTLFPIPPLTITEFTGFLPFFHSTCGMLGSHGTTQGYDTTGWEGKTRRMWRHLENRAPQQMLGLFRGRGLTREFSIQDRVGYRLVKERH